MVISEMETRVYQLYQTEKEKIPDFPTFFKFSHAFFRFKDIFGGIMCLRCATLKFPLSSLVWHEMIYMSILFRNSDEFGFKCSQEEIYDFFKKAFASIPPAASFPLHKLQLDFDIQVKIPFDALLKNFKAGINTIGDRNEMSLFREESFDVIMRNFNEEQVRKIYKLTLLYPPISSNYYLKCIEWEKSVSKGPSSINTIRQLYTSVTQEYGKQNHEIWMQFIEWETSIKEFQHANNLYWLAKKTLTNPEPFIIGHSMSINNLG